MTACSPQKRKAQTSSLKRWYVKDMSRISPLSASDFISLLCSFMGPTGRVPSSLCLYHGAVGTATPPCIVHMPRVAASSHQWPQIVVMTLAFLFFMLFWGPSQNTHRAQVGKHKKHLSHFPFPQNHKIPLGKDQEWWKQVSVWCLPGIGYRRYNHSLQQLPLEILDILLPIPHTESCGTVRHLCLTLSHTKSGLMSSPWKPAGSRQQCRHRQFVSWMCEVSI